MTTLIKDKMLHSAFIAILILFPVAYLQARNPFLPPTAFIPDGEPRVFNYKGKPRLFVYGSRDERITGYCGYGHDLWSAPVDDLTNWSFHGEIFHVKQVQEIGYGKVNEQHFGAPDCVYNPVTKKYHLYTFLGAVYKMDGTQGPLPGSKNYVPGFHNQGPKCVMAMSNSPAGPFTNPVMCDWPPANSAGTFDPAVLVDEQDDGSIRVYAYWGMRLKGDRWAELDPTDMHTIINPETGKPDRNAWHKTLNQEVEKQASLFEASSIRKVDDDKYVFIWSTNEKSSALSYCYGNSPEGPWKYGGRIVDNAINWRGGNNHGSIVKVGERWYVAYHRATNDSKNRQAMMEPIELSIKGDRIIIPQVEKTSQGVETQGLNPFEKYNAYIACDVSSGVYIDSKQREPNGLNPIRGIKGKKATVGFKYFNFGNDIDLNRDELVLKLHCKVIQPFSVTVYITPANDMNKKVTVAMSDVHPSGQKGSTTEIPIDDVEISEELIEIGVLQGKLAVFLEFSGPDKEFVHLFELEFSKKSNTD